MFMYVCSFGHGVRHHTYESLQNLERPGTWPPDVCVSETKSTKDLPEEHTLSEQEWSVLLSLARTTIGTVHGVTLNDCQNPWIAQWQQQTLFVISSRPCKVATPLPNKSLARNRRVCKILEDYIKIATSQCVRHSVQWLKTALFHGTNINYG